MSLPTNPSSQPWQRSTGGFVSVSTKTSGSTWQLQHVILPPSQLRRPTERLGFGPAVRSITASADQELVPPPAPAAQDERAVKAIVL